MPQRFGEQERASKPLVGPAIENHNLMETDMGLEIGFFVGAVILLAAIIYGAMANTRRNRANDAVTNKATKELYKDSDAYAEKEGDLRAQTRP